MHDAQKVPEDIQCVTVTHPGGAVEELKYWGDNPYNAPTATSAIYYADSLIAPVDGGTYTFRVTDKENHTFSREETLTVDPVGYVPSSSMVPAADATVGNTAVNFDWDDADGATYYSLFIFDYDFNRLYEFDTQTNASSYNLPAGFLEAGRLFRWRIMARREYYDDNVDNMSASPTSTYSSLVFSTTPPIDDDGGIGDGIPDYWEKLHGLNPAINDAGLDADNDGLTNVQEFQRATDPQNQDTDDDGVLDSVDAFPFDFYEVADSDSDGLGDNSDNCSNAYNPDQKNSDGDFYGDVCDNCPYVSNPDQTDTDTDGKGDACDYDTCPAGFTAEPSFTGDCENRPPGTVCLNFGDAYFWLIYESVVSWNTVGDLISAYGTNYEYQHLLGSNCIKLIGPDADADLVPDAYDNCPDTANFDQSDIDGDQIGDACDSDLVQITPGTYYVDPVQGTDDTAHGGSAGAEAWKSLHFALELINNGISGDYTLNLPAGTYSFAGGEADAALRIDQSLTIVGAGPGTTIIDGAGSGAWTTGLLITDGAPDVTIQGVSIRNFAKGIEVQSGGGCLKLLNVAISLNGIGLQLTETYLYDVDLDDSSIRECGTGLLLCGGTSNVVVRNGVISLNTGDGIRLEGSAGGPDDNTFTGIQVLENQGNGIAIFDGTGNRIEGCAVGLNNSGRSAYGGIAVFSGCNVVLNTAIQGNQCFGVYADDALSTQPLEATGNTWDDASGPSGVGPGSGDAVSENVVFTPWTGYVSTGDDDNDGWPNPAEIQAGTNPFDGSDFPAIAVFQVGGTGADDTNLGDAAHPLKTLHGAMARINGIADGSYTVTLPAGTYSLANSEADAALRIDQSLTIVGAGPGTTIIDGAGSGTWTTGLLITDGAPDVTIQGVSIRNFAKGIEVQSGGGCLKLLNVAISLNGIGLQLTETYLYDVDLDDSSIRECGTGLLLCGGTSNVVVRNGVISLNTGDGIRLEGSAGGPDDNTFTGIQVLENQGNGIAIFDGTGNRIEGCAVGLNNSGRSAYGGIAVFSGCNVVLNTTIQGNQCFGVYADDALSTQPLEATGNTWSDASGPSGVGPGSGDAVSENVVFTPWTGYVSTGDDDNDGWPNPAEVQAGTNPFDGSDFPAIAVFQVGGAGADDTNLGDADHPLKTLHGATTRVNGIADGSYTIKLPAGTYSFANSEADAALRIDQSLTIVGAGAGATVIDGAGSGTWTTGLLITGGAADVSIEGVTIRNFAKGIEVQSGGGCLKLLNSVVSLSGVGLQLAETYQYDVDLSGSSISGCGTGLLLCGGSSNVVVHSGVITLNTGDGIRLEGSAGGPVDNTFTGIQVLQNHGNGILILDGTGNRIEGCSVLQNNSDRATYGGIAVFSGCNLVLNNTIQGNQCFGVYADDALSTQPLEATGNTWDDASGPSGAGPGSGDAVSENVVFTPWTGYVSTGDDDNDGWPNLAEIQAGTDPNDRNSQPGIKDFHVGGTGADDNNLGTTAFPLKTLQAAVKRINGLVNDNYKIYLTPGTYPAADPGLATPLVLEQNVTIFGTGAILDGSGTTAWPSGLTLSKGAENVTIQGLTIRNFEEGIRIFSDGGCVTLNGVSIDTCTTGVKFVESFQLDVNMAGSTITDCATGIDFCAGTSNIVLHGGVVQNSSGDGIRGDGGAFSVDNIRIDGVQVRENAGNGIIFYDGSGHAVVNAVISNNNTGESGLGGVAVFSGCTVIDGCSFSGNHCYGVYADDALSTDPLDATDNWWGDDNGPYHAVLNPTGSGDPVSDNVEIEPWVGYQEQPAEPTVSDTNGNGLPDWWEAIYGVTDPDGDDDGDDISNRDEYLNGSDPTVPVSIAVTEPVKNPVTLDNVATITVSGTSANATQIIIERNAVPIATLTTGLEAWSYTVGLEPGENLIASSASDAAGNTATASVTVKLDSQSPTLAIENPTAAANYSTALDAISLSGTADDDTGVESVSWTRTAGSNTVTGAAGGKTNWTTSAIPLVENVDNQISVSVSDAFGKTGSASIVVVRKTNAVISATDLSAQGDAAEGDPRDLDGDLYQNEDETACGSDPDSANSTPENTLGSTYPTNAGDTDFNPDKLIKDAAGNVVGAYSGRTV